MDNKKIDNQIINSNRIINDIDNKLKEQKKKIRSIDEMQENMHEFNKNINKCFDLISKSIKGEGTNIVFEDIQNNNRMKYIKKSAELENETEDTMKEIYNLYKKKNEEIEKIKEAQKEKE